MQVIAKHHTRRRNFVLLCPLSTRLTPRTYTLSQLFPGTMNNAGYRARLSLGEEEIKMS